MGEVWWKGDDLRDLNRDCDPQKNFEHFRQALGKDICKEFFKGCQGVFNWNTGCEE